MKSFYSRLCLLFTVVSFISFGAAAQYCSPVINSSGISILQINFANYGDIAGGQIFYTTNTSNGYTQSLGTSGGTVKPYFGGGFFYSIANNSGSAKPYDFRGYADWNNDGDFNDANEQLFAVSGTVPAYSSTTTGNSVVPPLATVPGDYRVRFAVSESGAATACGTYTGEVEDYKITVPVNTAPVLNTGANTYLNALLSTATNSNGISVSELVHSSLPAASLIADGNDRNPGGWYNEVPRGVAIYGQTTPNGVWEYKVGAGAWTSLGAISSSNALLLMGDPSNANYQTASRIRFVPSGTGTPTFTYRAWDGTSGSNGSYANIVSTGGTTPFSTANLSATLPVIAPSGYNDTIYLSSFDNTIYSAPLNKISLNAGNAEPLLSNSADFYAGDISLDAATNKIFWIAGLNGDKIASANVDGSGQQLSLITGITYLTGLATGGGKIFYWNWEADYTAANLYQANTDGSGILKISGGAGQFNGTGISDTKDLEFYNNKIYFQYSDGVNFKIASANADGSGFTDLYSTTHYFGGLAVGDGNIYWTENDGTINKMAVGGGAVTVLATESGVTLNDIFADGTTLYFIEADGASNPTYSLIRKMATSGGSVQTVLTVSGMVSSLSFNSSASLLPVTLVDFTGQYLATNQAALLQWKTTGEDNFARFILERSPDGIHFAPVASIAASTSTAQVRRYQYTDDLKNSSTDKLYYRLQEVDLDGRSKYSSIVVIKLNAEATISKLYPNPGKDVYTIQLSAAPASPVTVRVSNSAGQLLQTEQFNSKSYGLNLARQASGIYYLQLIFADGSKQQFKLIRE